MSAMCCFSSARRYAVHRELQSDCRFNRADWSSNSFAFCSSTAALSRALSRSCWYAPYTRREMNSNRTVRLASLAFFHCLPRGRVSPFVSRGILARYLTKGKSPNRGARKMYPTHSKNEPGLFQKQVVLERDIDRCSISLRL